MKCHLCETNNATKSDDGVAYCPSCLDTLKIADLSRQLVAAKEELSELQKPYIDHNGKEWQPLTAFNHYAHSTVKMAISDRLSAANKRAKQAEAQCVMMRCCGNCKHSGTTNPLTGICRHCEGNSEWEIRAGVDMESSALNLLNYMNETEKALKRIATFRNQFGPSDEAIIAESALADCKKMCCI